MMTMEGPRLTITTAREMRAEIARLQSGLTAALNLAEAIARQCEKLRAAMEDALEYPDGTSRWQDILRAALAPEGEKDG